MIAPSGRRRRIDLPRNPRPRWYTRECPHCGAPTQWQAFLDTTQVTHCDACKRHAATRARARLL